MADVMCPETNAIGLGGRDNRLVRNRSLRHPGLTISKAIYTETRRMALRDVTTVNLSRAVHQHVQDNAGRHYEVGVDESEPLDVLPGTITFCHAERAPRKHVVAVLDVDTALYRHVRYKLSQLTNESIAHRLTPVENAKGLQTIAAQLVAMPSTTCSEPFLIRAQRLAERGRVDEALDIIYIHVDQLLCTDSFDQVDQLLTDANEEQLSLDLLMALLTVTLPAKLRLPSRADFYLRVEIVLRRRGELDEGLLTGLE